MSRLERALLALTLALFMCLSVIQVIVFGAPFGETAALDTRIAGYNVDDARAFLSAIGPKGHIAFFGYFRWVDTIFPPLLALSLVVLFRQIRVRRSGVIIGLFALLPLAYLFADLVENTFLKRLRFEDGFDVAVRFAQDATILKYSTLGVTILVLIGFALFERKASR